MRLSLNDGETLSEKDPFDGKFIYELNLNGTKLIGIFSMNLRGFVNICTSLNDIHRMKYCQYIYINLTHTNEIVLIKHF